MKKILTSLLVLVLAVSLVACSSKDKANGDAKNNKNNVTLKYANWNLGTEEDNNLERMMIKEFEKSHPNIKIEINESITTTDWNGTLSAAASAGTMPDLFMIAQIPPALANEWLMDLTDLTSKDKEFNNVPEVVRQSATFNDKVYALPFAQHFLGYYVNKDLFNDANLDYPEYGMDVDTFTSAVKDVTNVSNSVVGINNPSAIPDWYPAATNDKLGWFTYNDGKYELDGKEFINGIKTAQGMNSNGYAYEQLSEDQKAKFKGEDPEQVWQQGGIGLKWDGTWLTGEYMDKLDFEWDFVGVPGGRTVVVNDFVGISKSSKHPEEAYEFAKYMSYGKEGFMKRLEVADKEGKGLNTLPINTDEDVLQSYFDMLEVPGVRLAYENIDNGLVETVKTVPGFAASRWESPTGVAVGDKSNATMGELIDGFMRGDLKVEDYADQLDQLAEQKYEEAKKAIE
ncbi:ABC transporter substrate-binding protein [Rossellomorea marisflavi]|uniref:ABC transporter substrate-binding protein n=1 Tax=Rossellomorea marisflavi TaxID=189381 RepID=UPI00351610A9